MDNLVGPVALYPDALLAQVLVAATFPDQVDDAAQFVRSYGTNGIDDQPWDVSVKAVAHYPSALNAMADKGDWTTALGIAYAYQSSDVMAAVQRMRALASQQGNLESNTQQQVLVEDNNYVIVPAQPRVIYVPVYDPVVIYSQPIFRLGISSRYWSFGVGFPIGGWLSYDLDWRRRSVYYNGWNNAYVSYGGGWRGRSLPYVHITNVYVNPRYRTVYVNRDVNRRVVNYRNVERYAGYHRDARFDNRRYDDRNNSRNGRGADGRDRTYTPGNTAGRGNQPRTAQPRSGQATARPDGYSNGSSYGNRNTGNRSNNSGNDSGTRGGERTPNSNQGPSAQPQRSERPQVNVPQQRRSEPQRRASERMTPQTRVSPSRTPTSRATPSRTPTSRVTPSSAPASRATPSSAPRSAQPRGSSGKSGAASPRGATTGERRGN